MVKTHCTSVDHCILSIHHYPIQEKYLQVYYLLKHGLLFKEFHIPVWNIFFVMALLSKPLLLPFLLDQVAWHLIVSSLIYYFEWISWPSQLLLTVFSNLRICWNPVSISDVQFDTYWNHTHFESILELQVALFSQFKLLLWPISFLAKQEFWSIPPFTTAR